MTPGQLLLEQYRVHSTGIGLGEVPGDTLDIHNCVSYSWQLELKYVGIPQEELESLA